MSDHVTPLLRTLQWLLSPQRESQNQWHCWHPGQIVFVGLGERAVLGLQHVWQHPWPLPTRCPSTLTGSHVPCRTNLFLTENHCFIGIKGPMLSVPILFLLPLSHSSPMASALLVSQYLPVHRPCTWCSLFLKCSPKYPHVIQHLCMVICNLSSVTSSFPIG